MWIGLFLTATAVSTLGSIAGFGGGVFVVPAMLLFFNIPIEIAVGVTSLSLLPASSVSSLFNYRRKLIEYKLALALEPPTIIGAVLGASLTSLLPEFALKMVFAGFLLFLSWRTIKVSKTASGPFVRLFEKINQLKPQFTSDNHPIGLWSASLFGLLAGCLAGLLGIGGGILKTPLMLNVFKVPARRAAATGLFMIVFTSLASGISHYQLGHIDWDIFAPVGGGFFVGAFIGNSLGVKLNDQGLRKLIGISIALAGVAIILQELLTKVS